MPEITVNIALYCAKCGADLSADAVINLHRGWSCVRMEPCEHCLLTADDEGYTRGYEEGKKASYVL